MNELALFAGAGGGILGGKLLGWNTIGAVEIEKYPREVLLQRQRDGILGKFPIWDDITTFDGRRWEGLVDIISGGFPCQDISAAGKGEGIDGSRSGLWKAMSRVVDEIRPRFVFVENSPMLTSRGLGTVLGDLAKMGYDARWCVLGADDAGARHRRKRIWILGYISNPELLRFNTGFREPERQQPEGRGSPWSESETFGENMANSNEKRLQGRLREENKRRKTSIGYSRESCNEWWREDPAESTVKPFVGRVAHGVANRVDRLKATGNGQVPAVAAIAFTILSEGLIFEP